MIFFPSMFLFLPDINKFGVYITQWIAAKQKKKNLQINNLSQQ